MADKLFPFDALLVCDMQTGFVANMYELTERVTLLVQNFPAEKTYYTQFHNHRESLFHTEMQWGRFEDSADTAIIPQLQPHVKNAYKKYGYLLPEQLLNDLSQYKTVGICGVNTDICVLAAAYSLWDRDIRPYVLADYCGSVKGAFYHQAGQDLLNRPFGPQTIIKGDLI